MSLVRWSLILILFGSLVACGSNPTPSTPLPTETVDSSIAPLGLWSVVFIEKCQGREAKNIDVTTFDDKQIVFDEFTLTVDENGQYVGQAQFVAPMPEDHRDVIYTIEYQLTQDSETVFSGEEVIVESGGLSDGCPIQFIYQGEE